MLVREPMTWDPITRNDFQIVSMLLPFQIPQFLNLRTCPMKEVKVCGH